jgi:hypothetical protein
MSICEACAVFDPRFYTHPWGKKKTDCCEFCGVKFERKERP